MSRPFILGLTGGIGTGKTTVSAMLKEAGAYVIDADEISRHALDRDTFCYHETVNAFGEDVLDGAGNIDRKKLAAVVFSDEKARERLNGIIHPHVRRTVRAETELAAGKDAALVVWDIPLLFEAGYDAETDAVLVVTCPLPLRLERLYRRSGLSEEEALARIRAQMPEEERRRRADTVIDNSGSLEELREKTAAVYREILSKKHEAKE